MTLEEATTLMKEKRPAIDPIQAFRKQLQEYEGMCIELGSIATKKSGTKRKLNATVDGTYRKKIAPIGPALPPTSEKGNASSGPPPPIGPSLPPKKQDVIGPAIGPALRPAKEESVSSKKTIGPTLPPIVD